MEVLDEDSGEGYRFLNRDNVVGNLRETLARRDEGTPHRRPRQEQPMNQHGDDDLMSNETSKFDENRKGMEGVGAGAGNTPKKAYTSPKLYIYGPLHTLTTGGSGIQAEQGQSKIVLKFP